MSTPIECTVSKDATNGFRVVGKVVRVADAGLCWQAKIYVSGTPMAHWHSGGYDDAVAWVERMIDAYLETHSTAEEEVV